MAQIPPPTELIRQEIERLKAELPKQDLYTTIGADSICATKRYDELLSFIDSLPKETVTDCNELEEEVKKYINDNWEYEHSNENAPLYLYDFSDKDLLGVARHFAKWGAEHFKK